MMITKPCSSEKEAIHSVGHGFSQNERRDRARAIPNTARRSNSQAALEVTLSSGN